MTSAASASEEFDALVRFLSRGAAYGLSGSEVERVTTHAAVIFLVADRAYKVKRRVRYSFLDFTSPEKRRQALEAELRLNRRTAPMLYRRLVPVTGGTDGDYALGGEGEPVEWLLEMRRFDQAALLDRIAARGGLEDETVDDLAAVIAAFHDQAERRPDRGGAAGMREVIEGNATDFEALAGAVLPPSTVAALDRRTRAELERCHDLLEERRRAGHVRHCHGDLHLGNIVLFEDRPVLFDCLEFDEALASIDTFYDLAFLLMDLCHRELRAHAWRLLNGYLDATWDDGGVALLPLFLSCRAAIRAKVQGFAAELDDERARTSAEVEAARAYLDLAVRFLAPEPPRLVAIGGLSGSGKSTLARQLAPFLGAQPGAVLLRSDVVRKKLCGVPASERLGPEAYREATTQRVYATLCARAEALLSGGHAVIVDAVFLNPAERAQIEAAAARCAVPFDGLWLQAPAEVMAERVEQRARDASDATRAVVERQLAIDAGEITWRRLDGGRGRQAVTDAARAALDLDR